MSSPARRWTLGIALSPALVGIGAFTVMAADYLFSLPEAVVALASQTMIGVMLGGFVLAPGVGCTVAASAMLERGHQLGVRTAQAGLSLFAIGCAAIIFGLFSLATPAEGWHDPQSVSRPTTDGAFIVALPFVAMILGSLYAILVVSRNRAQVAV